MFHNTWDAAHLPHQLRNHRYNTTEFQMLLIRNWPFFRGARPSDASYTNPA